MSLSKSYGRWARELRDAASRCRPLRLLAERGRTLGRRATACAISVAYHATALSSPLLKMALLPTFLILVTYWLLSDTGSHQFCNHLGQFASRPRGLSPAPIWPGASRGSVIPPPPPPPSPFDQYAAWSGYLARLHQQAVNGELAPPTPPADDQPFSDEVIDQTLASLKAERIRTEAQPPLTQASDIAVWDDYLEKLSLWEHFARTCEQRRVRYETDQLIFEADADSRHTFSCWARAFGRAAVLVGLLAALAFVLDNARQALGRRLPGLG